MNISYGEKLSKKVFKKNKNYPLNPHYVFYIYKTGEVELIKMIGSCSIESREAWAELIWCPKPGVLGTIMTSEAAFNIYTEMPDIFRNLFRQFKFRTNKGDFKSNIHLYMDLKYNKENIFILDNYNLTKVARVFEK